jgi:methanogenic corrinoid protein MtbC1/DNA-binding XRE family transcriptional regulator
MTSNFSRLYLQRALQGDSTGAAEVIDSALSSGMSLSEVYTLILGAAQKSLGDKWVKGEINVAEEHLVSNITTDQMARLRARISPAGLHHRRVVVSTLPGDDHVLGARFVSDFFLMHGWSVEYLGRNTPTDDLVAFIQTREADVVALSISLKSLIPLLCQTVGQIKKLSPEILVIAGGIGLSEVSREEVNVHAVVKTPEEAVREAGRLIGLEERQKTLEEILAGVGEKIRTLRKTNNLNQSDLAERAELDRAYISAIEMGKKNVTIGSIYKIACALSVSIDDILRASEKASSGSNM